jgi:hypothetical protein
MKQFGFHKLSHKSYSSSHVACNKILKLAPHTISTLSSSRLVAPTLSQLAIARIGIAIKQVYSVWKQGRLAITRILRSKPASQADCSLFAHKKQMHTAYALAFYFA